jgi:hypothetical protein
MDQVAEGTLTREFRPDRVAFRVFVGFAGRGVEFLFFNGATEG